MVGASLGSTQTRSTRSGERIREGIGPCRRFIRSEGDKLKGIDEELREIAAAIAGVRVKIDRQAA